MAENYVNEMLISQNKRNDLETMESNIIGKYSTLGTTAREFRMEIESISKPYGLGPLRHVVIEECSFTLEAGKLTVLIGPSGCGKTTLINILAGYEAVESGSVKIDGKLVKGPAWDRLVVIFQETALFPWMTTMENVIFGPRIRGEKGKKELENEAMALLTKVGLAQFKDKYPS